jgi:hypothetical protein
MPGRRCSLSGATVTDRAAVRHQQVVVRWLLCSRSRHLSCDVMMVVVAYAVAKVEWNWASAARVLR